MPTDSSHFFLLGWVDHHHQCGWPAQAEKAEGTDSKEEGEDPALGAGEVLWVNGGMLTWKIHGGFLKGG